MYSKKEDMLEYIPTSERPVSNGGVFRACKSISKRLDLEYALVEDFDILSEDDLEIKYGCSYSELYDRVLMVRSESSVSVRSKAQNYQKRDSYSYIKYR